MQQSNQIKSINQREHSKGKGNPKHSKANVKENKGSHRQDRISVPEALQRTPKTNQNGKEMSEGETLRLQKSTNGLSYNNI